MTDAERLARYDRLLADLQAERDKIVSDMARLREQGKTKTVTYQQLIANKLLVQNLLSRFEIYGLSEPQQP